MEDVVDIVDSQKEKLLQTDAQFETVNRGIQDSLFKIGQIRDKSKILDESRCQMANGKYDYVTFRYFRGKCFCK